MASSGNLAKTLFFLTPYRRQVVVLVLLTVTMAVFSTIPPLLTRALVDQVITNGDTTHLLPLVLLYVGLPILNLYIGLQQGTLSVWVAMHFVGDIRNSLYRHLLRLSLRFFGATSVGKIENRLMDDSSAVMQMLTGQSLTIVSDLIVSSCAIVATILISWRLAIVLCLLLIVFVVNYRVNKWKIIYSSRALRSAEDRLSGGVQNRLSVDLAVKTFGAEAREGRNFTVESDATIAFGRMQGIANNDFWMNVGLINALGSSILYFLGVAMVLQGDLTYGDVLAFNQYAMQLLWPAVRFSQLAGQLQQVIISSDRLFEIFDEKPEIQDCEKPVDHPRLSGAVEFEDVHFHYVPGVEIIKGLTLHVKPGESIALIGPTGCGKSTVLNLLARYYDVTGGALKLDGIDIREFQLRQLRRQFGIVLQESHLFSTTILENIRYSSPYASQDEVIAAAKAAEIHDFIDSLPKGYQTMVGDFGVELSVGQKQRINIARAICANPAIMIMDEATSSLDSDSEAAIQRAMERVLKGRTSFVVAHRLSTIRNSSQIILLDKGVVQEHGTHDELMAIPNGRYHELYTKHIGKGVLED